jgi:hypothetical protein
MATRLREAKHPVSRLAGPYGHPFHPILVTSRTRLPPPAGIRPCVDVRMPPAHQAVAQGSARSDRCGGPDQPDAGTDSGRAACTVAGPRQRRADAVGADPIRRPVGQDASSRYGVHEVSSGLRFFLVDEPLPENSLILDHRHAPASVAVLSA